MDTVAIPTPETMHRGAKLFMDRGQAADYAEAIGVLRGYRMTIVVGDDAASSEAIQVALLTAVNVARRSMLGGVEVVGCPEAVAHTPLAGGRNLREAVIDWGGCLVEAMDALVPSLLIGDADVPSDRCLCLRVTWQGWAGGVAPVASGVRLDEDGNMHVAAALAATIGVGEVFQMLAGDCPYAGRRTAGVSLWAPMQTWTDVSSRGPDVGWLPSRLWVIGLGNLGQANLWCLGALPYADTGEVRLVLQDDDLVQVSNDSTSLLSRLESVGKQKARVMAAWAEAIGFSTRLEERRFGSWTQRSDFADDPAAALCGVDNAETRMALEDAGFAIVVEAGLGAGPQAYRDLAVHCFPGRRSARDTWARVGTQPATLDASSLPAYRAVETAGVDSCGILQLASRTVGVPFVGLTAAALAIGELLRRIHGGPRFDALATTLSSLEDIEGVPCLTEEPWLHGCVPTRRL